MKYVLIATGLSAVMMFGACTPTVKIEPSDKPIKIELNVKIDQEVRVRLEKDVEELIANNPDLF
ncbi:YnbE family lipoprotein [Litorimonas sp. RW-G-Af-16]|uniref:YnbE family lipoprotein n=1 Tax=Litorimonas sp. RW-G-Af-16 TaxID=3241168 RepID=UPI00390C8F68